MNLGNIGPLEKKEFVLYYDLTPDRQAALGAVNAVSAQVYAFEEPGTDAGKAGSAPTLIVAVDGSSLTNPADA
jgi:hypothetical protein